MCVLHNSKMTSSASRARLNVRLLKMKLASPQSKAIFYPMKKPEEIFLAYACLENGNGYLFYTRLPSIQIRWSSFFSVNHPPERYLSVISLDQKLPCFSGKRTTFLRVLFTLCLYIRRRFFGAFQSLHNKASSIHSSMCFRYGSFWSH